MSSIDPSMLGQPSFTVDQDLDSYSSDDPALAAETEAAEQEWFEEETEDVDEVDQLDSDTELDQEAPHEESDDESAAFARQPKIPGHTVLPAVRLENIIQADGTTGNLALSKEGLFVLSMATEWFIKRMTEAGHRQAHTDRRNLITYRDMASTTQQYQEFMFLHDTIPSPLSISEALQLRENKEKELLEEDPAMGMPTPSHASLSNAASGPSYSYAASRAKKPNGRRTNGSASASSSRQPSQSREFQEQRDTRPTAEELQHAHAWGQPHEYPKEYPSEYPHPQTMQNHVSVGADGMLKLSPQTNGHSSSSSSSHRKRAREERTMHHPPAPSSHYPNSHPAVPQPLPPPPAPAPPVPQAFHPQDEAWPGQYTGPASGFLQDTRGPFNRVVQNPGRTIYSQQHPQE